KLTCTLVCPLPPAFLRFLRVSGFSVYDNRVSDKLVINDPGRLDFRVHRAAMVDPAVLEREMRRIFDACWIYAGHESEVTAPGDFVTRTLCGRPILMSR